MPSLRKNVVTVQGVITPVPTVLGSEQAGSRPSSSSDRNATPVNSLAEVADRATSIDVFRRSSGSENTLQAANETPRSTIEMEINKEQREFKEGSPRQEFILKMRRSEEEAVDRCRKTLRRIRQAMTKQRNISMDVQAGISELEELIDVIEDYRNNWKHAEKEREASIKALEHEKKRAVDDVEESTPSTSRYKRSAMSPAEANPEKKSRIKRPSPFMKNPLEGKKETVRLESAV